MRSSLISCLDEMGDEVKPKVALLSLGSIWLRVSACHGFLCGCFGSLDE